MATLLKEINIIDIKKNKILENYDLLMEKNIIKEISKNLDEFLKNDKNIKIHNMKGKYLIPGLINLHQHYLYKRTYGPLWDQLKLPIPVLTIRAVKNALGELREGITTAREVGSLYNIDLSMKYLFEKEYILGPRLFISGQPLGITGSQVKGLAQQIDGVEECRKWTRQRVEYVDWIKVFTSYSPLPAPLFARPEMSLDELKIITEEAHNANKRVAAHTIGEIPLKNVIEAKVDTIEHGSCLNRELAIKMKERDIALVPTLTAFTEWQDQEYERGEEAVRLHEAGIKLNQSSFKVAMEEGVKIGMGLDSLGILKKEAMLMKMISNVSNYEILKIFTQNGAEILGVGNTLGTIEKGKIADLVVLSKNPIEDISNIEAVSSVIKNGKIMPVNDINLTTKYEDKEYNSMIKELLNIGINKENLTIL